MFRDPCETRVFRDPCVRRGGRGSCVTGAVYCWPPRVYHVCESVWQQCTSVVLYAWAVITVSLCSRSSKLQNVIEAQCMYGPLHDMGRFEQLTSDPRRRLGGMGWGCGYLAWEIGAW